MIWRYNILKRELHFYDGPKLTARYSVELLAALGFVNCDHDALRRLPISTQ